MQSKCKKYKCNDIEPNKAFYYTYPQADLENTLASATLAHQGSEEDVPAKENSQCKNLFYFP